MAKRLRSGRKKQKGACGKLPAFVIIALALILGAGWSGLDLGSFSDKNAAVSADADGSNTDEGTAGAESDAGTDSITEDAAEADGAQLNYDGETVVADADTDFDLDEIEIPEYSGEEIIEINDGETFFEEGDYVTSYYIQITELDELGRCGSAQMCADEENMQDGERGDISDIHPTGWHSDSIYNRSHLLMWKLSGCDDERNLITGTEAFNQDSMLEYEYEVMYYLYDHEDRHVIYRVTPLFEDDELVARGVLMEAVSVEDDGAGLEFCVFVYNVEDGYEIDYETGDYESNGS